MRARVAEILSPAIDTRAPYAKFMIDQIVKLVDSPIKDQTRLLRKWSANLLPADEYMAPDALAKKLLRMAITLDSLCDE